MEDVSYLATSQLNSPIHQREIELLRSGRSYHEVATATGSKVKSISERNRLVYKVDLASAFTDRVQREGLPSRLSVDDAFGYWFSGYFDGEGCLTVLYRERDRATDRRVGVQISCRHDDAQLLSRIQSALGIGSTWTVDANASRDETANWRVERIDDLCEVVVPLLDKYPLHSKKGREYAIWRRLVVDKYLKTLGGRTSRFSLTDEERSSFQSALEEIRRIRHGSRV